MSFMSIAPRPQTKPSRISSTERRHGPLGGIGGYDVEVGVDEQRLGGRVAAGIRVMTFARRGADSRVFGP